MYLTRYPAAVLGDRRHREHVRGRVVLDKDEVADAGVEIFRNLRYLSGLLQQGDLQLFSDL